MVDSVEIKEIKTAEDLLAFLRKGDSTKFEIGYDGWKVPCKLISATEMLKLTIQSEKKAKESNPFGASPEKFIAIETMKSVLSAATFIEGAPAFHMGFVDSLPERILSDLYDQYITINNTVNPNVQNLSPVEIQRIVEDVKKKKTEASDYFTYQLAEIGKFFLTELVPHLPTASGAGSQ